MRTPINLEAHFADAILLDSCAESERRTLRDAASDARYNIGGGLQTPAVARMFEVFDDQRIVGLVHDDVGDDAGVNARSRVTSRFTDAMACSISWAEVKRPRLKRSELCAS